MSLDFLQFTIPCETCIVQAMCKDKHYTSDIKLNKHTSRCLGVPDWDMNEKPYIKGLLECWVNIGWDMTRQLVREKSKGKLEEKKSYSIPNQYIDTFIDIIGTLQWMINSTSWNEGELYKFDSFEIEEKLKNITCWLTNGK